MYFFNTSCTTAKKNSKLIKWTWEIVYKKGKKKKKKTSIKQSEHRSGYEQQAWKSFERRIKQKIKYSNQSTNILTWSLRESNREC